MKNIQTIQTIYKWFLNILSCKKDFSNNDNPARELTNPFTEEFLVNNLRKEQPRLVLNSEIDKVLQEKLKISPVVRISCSIKLNAMSVLDDHFLRK